MNILIIGSGGFIGSHLYGYFQEKCFVWGVDLQGSTQPNFSIVTGSLDGLDRLFIRHKFDVCINASGNGSVPVSMEYPLLDFERNTGTVIKILELIRTLRPECKYINLSTAAVYGNPAKLPVSENVSLNPVSPYGYHKFCSELLCREYYEIFDIQTLNLRLFSIYGERLRKQLFWDIYQKTKHSSVIELFGTGNETRDFIYIRDLVVAVEKIIENGKFAGESINVATGVETSIREAATLFCSGISTDITLKFNCRTKPGDPLRWQADTSLLNHLGFTPQYTVKEGLINTAKWLKENA
jgi:dTDP-glucose 4,6-dehydratase/UDP-glucose 4-epimerase